MTLDNYLACFDTLITPTETLFRLVPPEKLDWKPTETSFTAGQLITHIGEALRVYGNGIHSGEWGFVSMREILLRNRSARQLGVGEAVALLHEEYAFFKERLGSLSEEEFNSGEVDTPQLGRVPRWRIAMLGMEHHITHKTQLFMYLKLLGVKVHTGTLYRG